MRGVPFFKFPFLFSFSAFQFFSILLRPILPICPICPIFSVITDHTSPLSGPPG